MTKSFYLKGRRIYLREVRDMDVNEQYYSWLNDPKINQYLETRFIPQSLDGIRNFVRNKSGSNDEPFFAICLLENGQHIGNIKLGPINWIHRRADISFFIGVKDLWGQGFAAEAISLVSFYAFNIIGLNKLKAGAYADNLASIKALEKSGFEQEGYFKGEAFCEGREMNVAVFGLRAAVFRKGGDRV